MKYRIELEVIAGLVDGSQCWNEIMPPNELRPTRDSAESVFEYEQRINRLVKTRAVEYVACALNDMENWLRML